MPIDSNEKALKEQKHVTVYAMYEMMRMFGIKQLNQKEITESNIYF